uniref:DUF569 domain-containing protein n=1 Tax=Leersia perrieri TaxID=77586 RepID=A0A0D9WM75_9ORYZ
MDQFHADPDADGGRRVYLDPRRATPRAAWVVHVLRHFDGAMLMLRSAVNGRYLGATATRWAAGIAARFDGLGGGDRVTLLDLERLPMFTAGWFPVKEPMGSEPGDVALGHGRERYFLRAIKRKGVIRVTVGQNTSPWVVEPIPPRDPIPPNGDFVAIGYFVRTIRCVRIERQNPDCSIPPVAWVCFHFIGRSLFRSEEGCGASAGFRSGLRRLTPLITDLPSNNDTMEIIVVTAGTNVAGELRYPDVDAV